MLLRDPVWCYRFHSSIFRIMFCINVSVLSENMYSIWPENERFRLEWIFPITRLSWWFLKRNWKPYDTSSASLYQNYPILPINKLIKRESCLLVYKINHGLLKSNVTFENFSHRHNTRNKDRYILDRQIKTMYGGRSPSFAGAKIYDQLPK